MVVIFSNKCRTLQGTSTKEERNEMAAAIVDFMGQRNPRTFVTRKIININFGIIFTLAEYDLDVDAPSSFPYQRRIGTET